MTKDKLRLALVQTDIAWEKIDENLAALSLKLDFLKSEVDIIILPEMFATGFTLNVEKVKEKSDGKIVSWMKSIAIELESAVIGSVIVEENNKLYNRAYFVRPNGNIEFYDKKHLFSLAGEQKVFSAGKKRILIDYLGWKIMPLVCYDLRFPVWSRNDLNYDLLIYIASWPSKRRQAWISLLKARAIENMTYLAGVNRVGLDGNSFDYSGNSTMLNPLGESMSDFTENEERIEKVEISKNNLEKVRTSLGFLNDMDTFVI
ncbi:MAG: amidohydrolase [Flavobacteriales bacterium]|nr:amidohydrolase [Flavobacteriales bacterium]